MTQEDNSKYLLPKETTYIQSVVGSFLYYARALDCSILPALQEISTQQPQATEKQEENVSS